MVLKMLEVGFSNSLIDVLERSHQNKENGGSFIKIGLLLTEWAKFSYFTVYSNRLHAKMRGRIVWQFIEWIYNHGFTILFICLC